MIGPSSFHNPYCTVSITVLSTKPMLCYTALFLLMTGTRTTGPGRQHSDIILGKLLMRFNKSWALYLTSDPSNLFHWGYNTEPNTEQNAKSHFNHSFC